jgi:hypothetical protein
MQARHPEGKLEMHFCSLFLCKSILGGGYFLTASVNRFYEAGKHDHLGK